MPVFTDLWVSGPLHPALPARCQRLIETLTITPLACRLGQSCAVRESSFAIAAVAEQDAILPERSPPGQVDLVDGSRLVSDRPAIRRYATRRAGRGEVPA
jgi:hypothetical protein